ncbi:LPS O-antigen chain length determinant protein WzzB [Aeromonas dhakensis]|uniref:LPS O-antigen chain length determinant protein WzzB n=1 Tax=Aeromonas dhakensis TaxID=196024 RepID=UPI003B9F53DB
MTNKEITNQSDMPIPHSWKPTSDDFDLHELLLLLWQQKMIVILMVGVFSLAGLCYAFLAPQVWISQAEIKQPTLKEIESLELKIAQLAGAQIPTTAFSIFDKKSLYNDFLNGFNSFNNKRRFLTDEGYLDAEATRLGITDERTKRLLLAKMADGINARLSDKLSDNTTLSFSASTAAEAEQRLEKYIDFIQQQELAVKNQELDTIWRNQLKMLDTQFESVKNDTLMQLQDDLLRTEYSLRITKAAGIEEPVQNLQDQGSLPIDLGAKALAEKLKVLKEIKNPEFMNPTLGNLRLQRNSLKVLRLGEQPFQSFSYLSSPSEPLSRDKPKRPLVVVLATLLGGMLGIGIVLARHAFRRPEQV